MANTFNDAIFVVQKSFLLIRSFVV